MFRRNARFIREVNELKWKWPALADGWNRWKYLLLVVVIGMVLLVMPTGEEKGTGECGCTTQQEPFDLEKMERKLEETLSRVRGVGKATVVLTLKESGRQVLARDTRHSDRENSSTAVVLSRGSGMEEAVTLQSIYPTYQGALVVCAGAEDARIRLQVMEAVRALTGLSAEKISVCKGQ